MSLTRVTFPWSLPFAHSRIAESRRRMQRNRAAVASQRQRSELAISTELTVIRSEYPNYISQSSSSPNLLQPVTVRLFLPHSIDQSLPVRKQAMARQVRDPRKSCHRDTQNHSRRNHHSLDNGTLVTWTHVRCRCSGWDHHGRCQQATEGTAVAITTMQPFETTHCRCPSLFQT